jgi:alpha-glucoside transport system substrate-binding protein
MRGRPVPRSALALCLLATSLAGGLGCSVQASPARVSVWASWTGAEGEDFQRVLRAFTRETGIAVAYTPTRALNDVLLSAVQRGSGPDIAVSGQGDLARYQRGGHVRPLDDVIQGELSYYDGLWLLPLPLPSADGKTRYHYYAVPIKANLKSIVWFDPKRFPAGANPPKTWDELAAAAAAEGGPAWCLGMVDVPNSGWPGADWIEDALLRQSGRDAFREWAAGRLPWTSPVVRRAWTFLGDLVAHSVRGGPTGALYTDFKVAASPMFANPPGCYLEHQGSFAMGFYEKMSSLPLPGADFDFFPLPDFGSASGDPDRFVAQPDLAAMFNDTPSARRLMAFLATARAQEIWPGIEGGGAFSMNKQVQTNVYRDEVSRHIARVLTSNGLCFEARNAMPPIMRSAYQGAVLKYLSDPGGLDQILLDLDAVRIGLQDEPWPALACT